jgi:hypothetical protein
MNYLPIDIVNAAIHLQKLRNAKFEGRQSTSTEINRDILTRNKSSKLLFNHESVLRNAEKYKIEEINTINAPLAKTVRFQPLVAASDVNYLLRHHNGRFAGLLKTRLLVIIL